MSSRSQPSRRSFLAFAAAAAAAPSLAWRWAPDAPKQPALKVGVASYSLRKFPLDRALEMCREMDVRYITIKDMHLPRDGSPAQIEAARAKIAAAGLTVMGGGVISMKNDERQVRRDFEYAKLAGFPLIVAAPVPEALDLVERMVREFSIPVAIHNHGPEDKLYPTPQDALRLIRNRDARLGLCMDVGHTVRAGGDPVATVHECRKRLFDLHLKDLRSREAKASQTEVGKGIVDFPGLFRALLKIRFAGHAALEYEINADNPLAGMKESFAYMRGVLAALA